MKARPVFAMLGLAAGFLQLGVGLPASAQDAAAGMVLAEQWCSACHAVRPGAGGSDQIPSFERIARERERSEEWLRTWLSVPHQSMPDLSLTDREITDLVAYFESLR